MRTFQAADPLEIQNRLRRRYIDRLAQRLRKMRRDLIARNWNDLKSECIQLKNNVESFGFSELRDLAEKAEESIPTSFLASRALIPSEAKRSLDQLLTEMDRLISVHSFHRPDQE